MHHQHRAFGEGVEIAVGNDDGDFDDAVGFRHQTGHFHVDPDEVVLVLGHVVLGWVLPWGLAWVSNARQMRRKIRPALHFLMFPHWLFR